MIPAHLLAKFPLRRGEKKSAVGFTWARPWLSLCLLFRNFKNQELREKKKSPDNSKVFVKSGITVCLTVEGKCRWWSSPCWRGPGLCQSPGSCPSRGKGGFHCRSTPLCCLWKPLQFTSTCCHFASFRQTEGKGIRVPLVYLKCKLQQC